MSRQAAKPLSKCAKKADFSAFLCGFAPLRLGERNRFPNFPRSIPNFFNSSLPSGMSRFCERIFWPAGPSSLSEFPDALGAGGTLAAQSLAKPQSRQDAKKTDLHFFFFAPLRLCVKNRSRYFPRSIPSFFSSSA